MVCNNGSSNLVENFRGEKLPQLSIASNLYEIKASFGVELLAKNEPEWKYPAFVASTIFKEIIGYTTFFIKSW